MPDDLTITSQPSFVLWQADNRRQQSIRAILRPLELNYVEFTVLSVVVFDLHKMPGTKKLALTQQELSELLKVDKMLVSQAARSLARKGMVFRIRGFLDSRTYRIRPLPKGTRSAKKAARIINQLDKRLQNERINIL